MEMLASLQLRTRSQLRQMQMQMQSLTPSITHFLRSCRTHPITPAFLSFAYKLSHTLCPVIPLKRKASGIKYYKINAHALLKPLQKISKQAHLSDSKLNY